MKNRTVLQNNFEVLYMCKWLRKCAIKEQPWAWLALRVLAGIMFAMHGAMKLFGWFNPDMLQSFTGGMGFFGLNVGVNMLFVAGVIEFFGGLLLVVGLATRGVAALAMLLMVLAYLSAHAPKGWSPLANGGELAVMYFLVWFVIFAFGAGPYSLDAKWCPDTKKELKKRK